MSGKFGEIPYDLEIGPSQTVRRKSDDTGFEVVEIAILAYPIDSIYTSVSNTDPNTLFGGTWELLSTTPYYIFKRTA